MPADTPAHSPNARRWRLGTRASPLAMAQAREVRDRLGAQAIEIVSLTASGDRIQDRPLAEIGGKALWTKELDARLAAGEIDFAVHSAKDVETLRPAAFAIAAVLPREDVADVLVGAASLSALPAGARIGTSAPRRAAQALHLRPDCTIVPFRGNVATRLARLERGEAEATLLARAGLNRLGHGDIGAALDPAEWLPAPGQGAILVEARANDAEALAFLAAIDHAPSRASLLAERVLLAALGGGCHSPVAVLTRNEGPTLHMRVALFSPDGAHRVDGEARFAPGDSAALAASLLARAPAAIAAHFTGAG